MQAGTTVSGIGIGHGSSDVRLRNLNVLGGGESIAVFENRRLRLRTSRRRTRLATPAFTIRLMCTWSTARSRIDRRILARRSRDGRIAHHDVCHFDHQYAGWNLCVWRLNRRRTFLQHVLPTSGVTDVTIDSPAATNFNGVEVITGGSLNVTGAKLVINHAGQTWGGTTGGVLISDGAAMNAANGLLVINRSYGQGLMMLNNSYATVSGATITTGGHGGVVLANSSRIDVSAGNVLTLVGGNAVDIFCDAGSNVTGSVNLSGCAYDAVQQHCVRRDGGVAVAGETLGVGGWCESCRLRRRSRLS